MKIIQNTNYDIKNYINLLLTNLRYKQFFDKKYISF